MQHDFVVALMLHDFLLARIRLTRMAAERGPILSGATEPGPDLRQNLEFTPLVAQ